MNPHARSTSANRGSPEICSTSAGLQFKDLSIEGMTSGGAFRLLGERSPDEFVIGHISDVMKPVVVSTSEDFEAVDLKNGVKVAWNFRAEALDEDVTRLHTETRINCHGTSARRVFRLYWLVVKPFSGLIRKEMLKAAATTNQIATLPRTR